MFDFFNIPREFWSSLEFVCVTFGLLPLILSYVLALMLISVDIVRESKWYKKRRLRTVHIQTDDDLELMEFYASGASPLDLIPDTPSSSGSPTPPYPSTSTSDPGPSTSSQSTSSSSSTTGPSTSAPSSTPDPSKSGLSPSGSSESNQSPEPSNSPPQTTQLMGLPEIIVTHQASESGVSSASDCLDGSASPLPPPPKITSILWKNTSSENLSTGKSASFQKSPMRMTLSSNSNWYNTNYSTISTNPFDSYGKPWDDSDDLELLHLRSSSYYRNPFTLWSDDFSSSENAIEESPDLSETELTGSGITNPAFDHTENEMSSSPDSICKTKDATDRKASNNLCKSSLNLRLSSKSDSVSRDQYCSEIYMGIV